MGRWDKIEWSMVGVGRGHVAESCHETGGWNVVASRSMVTSATAYRYLRRVFHWQFSSFVIALLFSLGVAFWFANHFVAAYISVSLSLMWALCYWQVSDFLDGKRKAYQSAQDNAASHPKSDRKQTRFKSAKRGYFTWSIAISLVIVLMEVGGMTWIRETQTAYELSLMAGVLLPANDPSPTICAPRNDELAVYMDEKGFETAVFPQTIFSIRNVPVISIDRTSSGEVTLSLDIRSADGKLIVRMRNNRFQINKNNYFSMKRPDLSTLIVYDQNGAEVLNARFLNPHAFRLSAKIHSSGEFLDTDNIPGFVTEAGVGSVCFEVVKGAKVGAIVDLN
jgi:hypothetical protein